MEVRDESHSLTVVYGDDDAGFGGMLASWFENEEHRKISIKTVDTEAECRKLVSEGEIDGLVFSDSLVEDPVGFANWVAGAAPSLPTILFAESGDPQTARAIRKAGAMYLHRGTGTDQFETLADEITSAAFQSEEQDANHHEECPFPVLIQRDGMITSTNDKFNHWMAACYEEQFKGSDLSEYILHGDSDLERAINRAQQQTSDSFEAEVRLERVDNTIATATAHVSRVVVGDAPAVQIIFVDQSEHALFKEKIDAVTKASRSLMTANDPENAMKMLADIVENILEFSLVCVWKYDVEDNVLRPVGVSEDTKRIPGNQGGLDPVQEGDWAMDAFERGEVSHIEDYQNVENKSQDGLGVGTVLLYPLGRHGVITVGSTSVVDISETQKQLLEAISRHGEVTIERVKHRKELQQLETEMQDYEETIDAVRSIISDQLRGPLNKLREHFGDREDGIEVYFERLDSAIEELIRLTKYGWSTGQIEPFSLEDSIRTVWEDAAEDEAELVIDGDLHTVIADRSRVEELLEHIFENSTRHNEGRVTVTVGSIPDGFYVEDTGDGLPDGDVEVFEAGKTLKSDRTGVGLTIVQNIVNGHGWEIETTESEVGGVRFEFTEVKTTQATESND